MVTVVKYEARKNAAKETFFVLVLQGDLELIQSEETGKYYATAKKATIVSTFDEVICQQMVGNQLAGSIIKVECEPYQCNLDSGEELTMDYRWEYCPDEVNSVEEAVFHSGVPV